MGFVWDANRSCMGCKWDVEDKRAVESQHILSSSDWLPPATRFETNM